MYHVKRDVSVVALLLLLAGLTWWFKQDQIVLSPDLGFQEQGQVDGYLTNFTVTTMNDAGRPAYLLQADKMVLFSNSKLSQVEKPVMTVYRENAQPWLISSQQGLVHSDKDLVFLTGQVRMIGKDELGNITEVLTEKLEVHPKAQYAQSDNEVEMLHYQGRVAGIGLQANLKEGQLSLLNNVRSRYETSHR